MIKLIDWDTTYGSIYTVRTSLWQKDPDIRYVVIQEHNIKCNTFILRLLEILFDYYKNFYRNQFFFYFV